MVSLKLNHNVIIRVISLLTGFIPVLVVITMITYSLYMLGDAILNTDNFSKVYIELLLMNGAIFIVLFLLISINFLRLIRNCKRQEAGSRLTAQFVMIFVLLAMVPVTTIYYFSYKFINKGIDSWFHFPLEKSLQDALSLSQRSFDENLRNKRQLTEQLVYELIQFDGNINIHLDLLREKKGAIEVALFEGNGHVVSFSTVEPTILVPDIPDETILSQARNGGTYTGVDKTRGDGLYVRIVMPIPSTGLKKGLIIQALYSISKQANELVNSIEAGVVHYNQLKYFREPLKDTFSKTLLLICLLSLFASIWGAFYAARRIISPITVLTSGTKAVADGDFSKRLPSSTMDELGQLIESFNEMTERLGIAKKVAAENKQKVDDQKAYLETVLRHLSSGVLTFTMKCKLYTTNKASLDILNMKNPEKPVSLDNIVEQYPKQADFFNVLQEQLRKNHCKEWRKEIRVAGNKQRQVLMLRGSPLNDSDGKTVGYVVVFDDISALLQAQRDAAWGEVARRLAHEIKNPLTPIQLSAERLRYKLLNKISEEDAHILDKATYTIVMQVENMKEMVNAFSEYAKAPILKIKPTDINQLIAEVIELYSRNEHNVTIEPHFDFNMKGIAVDAGRFRQMMNNLFKNALEALNEIQNPVIKVITKLVQEDDDENISLSVQDNGLGFPKDIMETVFEPYVTKKKKGTGLGLAIVKKIVEEHNGIIIARNHEEGGAEIMITIPLETINIEGKA